VTTYRIAQPVSLVVCGVLFLSLLLFATNLDLPYEQDQGSKAAHVLYLAETNHFFDMASGPFQYKGWALSAFYLLSLSSYKLFGGDVMTVLNLQSAVLGLLTFLAICLWMKRAHGVGYVYTFIVFSSMPLLIINSSYGNEVALSLCLFVLALLLLTYKGSRSRSLSAIAFCLAVFARIDTAFLGPYWLLYAAVSDPGGSTVVSRVRRLIPVVGIAAIFSFLFWVLFVRELPQPVRDFLPGHNLKLTVSYLVYPFNPSIVAIAGIALPLWFRKEPRKVLVHAMLLFPAAFYLVTDHLDSPKYILVLSLFHGVPCALVLARLPKYSHKTALVLFITLWFFVSVSPFGIKLPGSGEFWTVPTSDGYVPTGAYLAFYDRSREGFYQERYSEEIRDAGIMIQRRQADDRDTVVLGSFNSHFLALELARGGIFESSSDVLPITMFHLPAADSNHDAVWMPRRSYLRPSVLDDETREEFLQWLRLGKVKTLDPENALFPRLIEIGETVGEGNDVELGQRILALNAYTGGYGAIPSVRFVDDYRASCWLARGELPAEARAREPYYADDEAYAFGEKLAGCEVYRLTMPIVYYEREADVSY